jgi:hypothetical protein
MDKKEDRLFDLWDHYAGKALEGILASGPEVRQGTWVNIVEDAADFADLMMAVRKKRGHE